MIDEAGGPRARDARQRWRAHRASLLTWWWTENDAERKVPEEIDDHLSRYPVKRSALIPLLYLAQRDEGFITEAAMKEIAGILKSDAAPSV